MASLPAFWRPGTRADGAAAAAGEVAARVGKSASGVPIQSMSVILLRATDDMLRSTPLHSTPPGGGVGSGRSRMGSDWRMRPRLQTATICLLRFRSTPSMVTGTPSTVVSNGTPRFSSIIVNLPEPRRRISRLRRWHQGAAGFYSRYRRRWQSPSDRRRGGAPISPSAARQTRASDRLCNRLEQQALAKRFP